MSLTVPRTYAELLRQVQATLFAGQREIEVAWVRTYHETGRLIHAHVLLEQNRAHYGAQVIHRLARDTATNERRLYECRQFYRCFPILRISAELGWSRGLLLSQVADPAERETLVKQVLKHDWPSEEIKARVRALNAAADAADTAGVDHVDGGNGAIPRPKLLQPKRGTPGLHPIVDRGDGPAVDLGFKLDRALGPASKLTTADIVRLDENGVRRIDGATKAELFTYAATIRRVVDGDTLVVALMVAPGIKLNLKLRLRGLDCPELSTPAGRAAKRFVEQFINAGDEVVLSTTKPDKYDRYLADVFVRAVESSVESSELGEQAGAAEVFLNNALLENDHAVRYDGIGPKEEG